MLSSSLFFLVLRLSGSEQPRTGPAHSLSAVEFLANLIFCRLSLSFSFQSCFLKLNRYRDFWYPFSPLLCSHLRSGPISLFYFCCLLFVVRKDCCFVDDKHFLLLLLPTCVCRGISFNLRTIIMNFLWRSSSKIAVLCSHFPIKLGTGFVNSLS